VNPAARALIERAAADADAGRFAEAVEACEEALALAPDFTAARAQLAWAQRCQGDTEAAIANFEAVLAREPANALAQVCLALAQDDANRPAQALALLDAAAPAMAADPQLRWLAAGVLLRAGDYARGFDCFESRWLTGNPSLQLRRYRQPPWDGGTQAGKRLLVWHEQGLGDTLLCLRFAARAAARGMTVLADVQPTLRSLVALAPGVAQVVGDTGPAPEFDCHLPAMSLPRVLGVTPEDAGAGLPGLAVPAPQAAKWQALLPASARLRVGLAWRSSISTHDAYAAANTLAKSMPLAALSALGDVPGVEYLSLQVGDGAHESRGVPGLKLTDLTAHIDDMADTAALIDRLDLVITIDTVIAHVAGSMGTPLAVLSQHTVDWRYTAGGTTSPWYPQARILRQAARNDWRVAAAGAVALVREMADARRPAGLLARWLGR
jgi:tetratricopeptide (TPR) repeat protein